MLQQRTLEALVKFICVSRIPYSIGIGNWSFSELVEIIAGEGRREKDSNFWPGLEVVKTAIINEEENTLNTLKINI